MTEQTSNPSKLYLVDMELRLNPEEEKQQEANAQSGPTTELTQRKDYISTDSVAGNALKGIDGTDTVGTGVVRWAGQISLNYGHHDSLLLSETRSDIPLSAGLLAASGLLAMLPVYANKLKQDRLAEFNAFTVLNKIGTDLVNKIKRENDVDTETAQKEFNQQLEIQLKNSELKAKYEKISWEVKNNKLYLAFKEKAESQTPKKETLWGKTKKLRNVLDDIYLMMVMYFCTYWFQYIFRGTFASWPGVSGTGFGYGIVTGSLTANLFLGIGIPLLVGCVPLIGWRIRNWALNHHPENYQNLLGAKWAEKHLFSFTWIGYKNKDGKGLSFFQHAANIAALIPNFIKVFLWDCPRLILGTAYITGAAAYLRVKHGKGKAALTNEPTKAKEIAYLMSRATDKIKEQAADKATKKNSVTQNNQVTAAVTTAPSTQSLNETKLNTQQNGIDPTTTNSPQSEQLANQPQHPYLAQQLKPPSNTQQTFAYVATALTKSIGMWTGLQFFIFTINDQVHLLKDGGAGPAPLTVDVIGTLAIIVALGYGVTQVINQYYKLQEAKETTAKLNALNYPAHAQEPKPEVNDNKKSNQFSNSSTPEESESLLGSIKTETNTNSTQDQAPSSIITDSNLFSPSESDSTTESSLIKSNSETKKSRPTHKFYAEEYFEAQKDTNFDYGIKGFLILSTAVGSLLAYRFAVLPKSMETYIPAYTSWDGSNVLDRLNFIIGFAVFGAAWVAMKYFLKNHDEQLDTIDQYGSVLYQLQDYQKDVAGPSS